MPPSVAEGTLVHRARRKARAVAVAAHVGDEIDGDTAAGQLLGQREGGKQVAAGPAGRQHHRA